MLNLAEGILYIVVIVLVLLICFPTIYHKVLENSMKIMQEKQETERAIKSGEFFDSVEKVKKIIDLLMVRHADVKVIPSAYKYSYADMDNDSDLRKEAHAQYDKDSLIYFHVTIGDVSDFKLKEIQMYDRPGVDREELDKLIAIKWFGFEPEDISTLKEYIDIFDFVWAVTKGKLTHSSSGYYSLEYTYSMVTPCGLTGENREFFLNEFKSAYIF